MTKTERKCVGCDQPSIEGLCDPCGEKMKELLEAVESSGVDLSTATLSLGDGTSDHT